MTNDYKKVKTIIIITLIAVTILAAYFGIAKYIFGCFGGASSLSLSGALSSNEIPLSKSIRKIDIDMSIANIEITSGKSGNIQYLLPENIVPTITESDGTLSIRQNGSFNFLGNPNMKEEWKIVITLPGTDSLSSLQADLDLGNVSIKNLEMDDLSLDLDCGNATFDNISVNGLLGVNADLGNVEGNNLTCGHLFASLDAGNLEINTCEIDKLEVEVDLGKAEIHAGTIHSGTVKNDCGDIIIEGDIDALTANDSLGSITINTSRPESGLTLNVDLGSITVNGHKWK